MRLRTVFFIILTNLLALSSALACDSGFQSFQSSVFAKVRRDCAGCHDGNQNVQAPPFALNDPLKSYNQLIHYVNFADSAGSLLSVRAGNNHCKISLCQTASGQDMATQISAWWAGGENKCQGTGVYSTANVPLPTSLPAAGDGFTTMTFDLSAIKPELKGMSFQIEVQDYLAPSLQTKGTYRFRSPRFVGGSHSIYVKGVKVLLDGAYAPTSNSYDGLDRSFGFFPIADPVTSATTILSGDQILVMKDGQTSPTISISFMDIHARNDTLNCTNQDAYIAQVKPLVNSLNCVHCHQSQGKSIGEKTFNLAGTDALGCQTLGQLLDPQYLMISAAIKVPAEGIISHPQLTDAQRSQFVSALRGWLAPATK